MSDDLIVIARRMACELIDYAKAAREAGCPIKKTEDVIKEFNNYEHEHENWQDLLLQNTVSTSSLNLGKTKL